MPLKILFIGDVVGSPGRKIVSQVLPRLIRRWGIGLVVCNAENAAGGSGLTTKCHEELVEAGVDVFTMGDHVYRKDEVFALFERTDTHLRPANFPPDAPGAEFALVQARDGTPVGVFTLLGRTFMRPVDCPFRAADRVLEQLGDGQGDRRRRPRRGDERQATSRPLPRRPRLRRARHAHARRRPPTSRSCPAGPRIRPTSA